MNLLYIGSVYSDHLADKYRHNCKSSYQFAAQALQNSLINGLLQNEVNLTVLTFPCLPTFPFSYRKAIIKPDDFIFNEKKLGSTVGRLNLPIIKFDSAYKRNIDQWINEANGNKFVLIYSLEARFLKIAKYIKTKYPDVTIGIIVADLPEFMSWNKYYIMLGLQKRDVNTIFNNLQYIDRFILLSKYMVEKLPIKDTPWIVMEGIFDSNSLFKSFSPKHNKQKSLLYTGNIDRRYGIMDAINAFTSLTYKDISFQICGFGDTENDIREMVKRDGRIKFYGAVPRSEALKLQQEASILINPRHSSEEYTKYSFPSKTMEYLASGTPVLMCRLASIPKEYEKYLYFIDNESIDGYAKAIANLIEKREKDLSLMGYNARDFILNNKNPYVQTKKIIDFIQL